MSPTQANVIIFLLCVIAAVLVVGVTVLARIASRR